MLDAENWKIVFKVYARRFRRLPSAYQLLVITPPYSSDELLEPINPVGAFPQERWQLAQPDRRVAGIPSSRGLAVPKLATGVATL